MKKQFRIFDRIASFLVPITALVAYCLHASTFRGWLSDDAGISFAYAHNFIHGHGLVSQIGVPPVEGFSNFLWTIILSPFFISPPVNPAVQVKIFSAVCVLITYLILQKCIVKFFDEVLYKRLVTAVILILLSINTSFVTWTTSGLENALYVLLAALLFYLILKHESSDAPSRTTLIVIAIVGTMIALTRPDGILFVFVFPLYLVIKMIAERSRYRNVIGHALIYALAVVVLYGGFMAFRYIYFNDTKPNAYYVKGGPTLMSGVELIMLTRFYVIKTHDLLASMFSRRAGLVTVLLIIISTFFFMKARKRMPYIVLLLMLLTSWAIYCLLPQDWMGEYRFATPCFVFLYAYLCLITVCFISIAVKRSAVRASLIIVFGVALIVSTALLCIPRSRNFAASPPLAFHIPARTLGIRFNCYADQLDIDEASLLCPDTGGTLYFSRHLVYDLGGLFDRTIAKTLKRDTEGLKDYVFDDIKPTFIHIHDYWSMITDFEHDPRFRRDYFPIREGVSAWAEERTGKVYYSGDYVRKNAIRDTLLFEQFKDENFGGCLGWFVIDTLQVQPFPRR